MPRNRPWLASLLAVVYPGLGHVYLRAWVRAASWFGLALLTAVFVVPESVVRAFETGGFEAFVAATRAIPAETMLPLFVVRLLNVIDAYWHAKRLRAPRREPGAGATCPNCGKDLDEELDFCPWCTVRLGEREPEAATSR